MTDTRENHGRGATEGDVLVRRGNGEFSALSALTGPRAVIVLGETMHDLGSVFDAPALDGKDSALIVGIHRLEPADVASSVEIVFDDAHAVPEVLHCPSIPVAYIVRGLTPLGPAAVGPEEIEQLLQGFRARRQSGAISLDDLT